MKAEYKFLAQILEGHNDTEESISEEDIREQEHQLGFSYSMTFIVRVLLYRVSII
ncbi:hypothetical protein JNUCC31_18980 [Paenibacillus sp. JNUCC31]|uniref:hypothetical protein n=1 Tax=Paenibacillus sp. JNUCC-31 TaxID=2777983 RepID=UPI00178721FB|nr:hypothetical protein [Paenibacillus sp. JNUCC-31]QOS76912.1 hypothetical protein JNUCC31_18980 [Paenibacillus sp. JNUCC-31]